MNLLSSGDLDASPTIKPRDAMLGSNVDISNHTLWTKISKIKEN